MSWEYYAPNSFETWPADPAATAIPIELLHGHEGPLVGYQPIGNLGLPHGGHGLSHRDRLEIETTAMDTAALLDRDRRLPPPAPITPLHLPNRITPAGTGSRPPHPANRDAALAPRVQPAHERPDHLDWQPPRRPSETTLDEPIGARRPGWLVAAGAAVVTLVAGIGYALSRPDEKPNRNPGAVAGASYVPNLSCKVNVVGEEGDQAYIDVAQVHGQPLGNRRVVLATLGERTIAGVAQPTGETNRYGFDPTAFRGADVAVYAENGTASPLCGVVNVGGPGAGDENFSGRTAPQYFEQLLPKP
jgi:hypothetical protein